jgi:hypothetical protein
MKSVLSQSKWLGVRKAIAQQRLLVVVDPDAALGVDEVTEPLELSRVELFQFHGGGSMCDRAHPVCGPPWATVMREWVRMGQPVRG